jgi:hypothetical protein
VHHCVGEVVQAGSVAASSDGHAGVGTHRFHLRFAQQHIEERGLAGSGGSQHRAERARGDGCRHPVQHLDKPHPAAHLV